jgi:Glycosyl hydrolases family 2, sugar binding domain/Glycosyl hydrolases family 2, TIM barrel domain/Glycosyl hydrolases family 2
MTTGVGRPANRQILSLDGIWDLHTDGGRSHKVAVPGPWQAASDELRGYTGSGRYGRDLSVPENWSGSRMRLIFGAVDYRAEVSINGTVVGAHEGGYLPFAFEVQEHVRPGASDLLEVQVWDDVGPDVPAGKQSWYGPLAGIWQSVALERVGPAFIERAEIVADPWTGEVNVVPYLAGESEGCAVTLVVMGPDGTAVAAETTTLVVPRPVRWELDEPALYSAELRVSRDGREIDRWRSTFGFRTIDAKDGRIFVNDRPIFLAGALDQDYHRHGICTAPSGEFFDAQARLVRELGLNCLRCHIKVPDPRYLDAADRAGILVWEELPSWAAPTKEAKRRARETLTGMIERDRNHPSVIAWTVANESWGLDLVGSAADRAWLRETAELTRELDPTRLVVDNSPCAPNFHLETDVNDMHEYAALPDHAERWEGFLAAWVTSPGSTYSPHGDAARRGDEPMIISEFGNWGLPDPAGLRDRDGKDPWWFSTGGAWSEGVVVPEGVEERARLWGLERAFGDDLTALWRSSQQHQFESLRYEVERLRLHPEISGFVVTELSDVYWECNGLLDMDRAPKAGHAGYASLFGPDLPIGVLERPRCSVGEPIDLALFVAHSSQIDLSGCEVRWRFRDVAGSVGADVPPWSAPRIGSIALRTNQVGRHELDLELIDRRGTIVGRNTTILLVLEAPTMPAARSDEPNLTSFLAAAGCPADPSATKVATTAGEGVRLTLAREDAGSIGELHVAPRAGTPWEGDWAQGLHWLGGELRRDTPLIPRMDLTWRGLVPPAVLEDCEPDRTLSGLYVGWVRRPVATTARLAGGCIASTIPLVDANPADPLVRTILSRLLELASP